MSVFIRQAIPQDWPGLQHLFLSSRRSTYSWLDTEAFRLSDMDEQTAGEALWVAQDTQGELVSFISRWEASHFIHHLYIAATCQRCGVGKMLLQSLPEWKEQSHQLKCLLHNKIAQAFYFACGFSAVGEGKGEDGSYLLLEHVAKPTPLKRFID